MFRKGFTTVLVILGCLIAGPAAAIYVLVGEITDKESYLEVVGPLADDPAVQSAIADKLTAAVGSAAPAGAREAVDTGIRNFVASPEFKQAWITLNEQAQPAMLALLREEQGGTLAVKNDAVVLDLGVLAGDVKTKLAAEGVPAEAIPDVAGSVEVFSGPAVRKAVSAFSLVETLRIVLPIAALLLILGGLALSTRRARTLVITGVGLAVVMLLDMLGVSLLRSQIADHGPVPGLTGAFYDAITGGLPVVLWTVFGIGALCAIGGIIMILARRRSGEGEPQSRQAPLVPAS